MVFQYQYQYQYQYQLQRGLGFTTYESFSQLLKDTFSSPILVALLLAVLPLIVIKLYSFIRSAEVYRRLSSQRKADLTKKLAREEFQELFLAKPPKGAVLEMFSLLLILGIGVLLFTKSMFFVAVVSDSMAPVFWKGDIVVAESITNKYVVGDIIVFTSPKAADENIVHRIHSIDGESIRTKGDNQNNADDWVVTPKEIKGKLIMTNGMPLVFKKIGRYFIEYFDPYKEEEPIYRTVRDAIGNVHAYGIFYILAIILIILLGYINPAVEKIY